MTVIDEIVSQLTGILWDKWTYYTKPGLPIGNIPIVPLWWLKISASGGHQSQIAFYSPVDVNVPYQMPLVANRIYIMTHVGDTPNYGSMVGVVVSPPCANWYNDFYYLEEPPPPPAPPPPVVIVSTRDQTAKMRAAIRGPRSISCKLRALVATNIQEQISLVAAVVKLTSVSSCLNTAIQTDLTKSARLNAAIQAELELEVGVESAIAINPEIPCALRGLFQGNLVVYTECRAAVEGENEIQSGMTALVLVSREDQIYNEMENLFPQENDLRSIPNWPSHVKDWRKDTLGA